MLLWMFKQYHPWQIIMILQTCHDFFHSLSLSINLPSSLIIQAWYKSWGLCLFLINLISSPPANSLFFNELISSSNLSFFIPISSIFEVNHSSFPFFIFSGVSLKQCMGSSFLTYAYQLLKLLFLTWNETSVFELLDKLWQCIHTKFLLLDYFRFSFFDCIVNELLKLILNQSVC